jgi:hypothetical protein
MVLAACSTPNLKDYPLFAIHNCLFNASGGKADWHTYHHFTKVNISCMAFAISIIPGVKNIIWFITVFIKILHTTAFRVKNFQYFIV